MSLKKDHILGSGSAALAAGAAGAAIGGLLGGPAGVAVDQRLPEGAFQPPDFSLSCVVLHGAPRARRGGSPMFRS